MFVGKITLIAIFVTFCATVQAQYSSYYNVNVNRSGTVYEHKTITTIDYGALALANAQSEANRLENIKYSDEREKRISLEVASNPVKAYDYGYQSTAVANSKDSKSSGFKSFTMSYRVPHNSLFVQAGEGRFENVSSDGITTEIIFYKPFYNKEKKDIDVEKDVKMENMIVGQLNDNGSNGKIFVHKKDINRATVFGVKGFKGTLIGEDDYEYTINDIFVSYDTSKKNGVEYGVQVRTYGNKDEVTFEELEGRRYYLRQLIEKIISTAVVYDMKY